MPVAEAVHHIWSNGLYSYLKESSQKVGLLDKPRYAGRRKLIE
jgi:hypothetical protein